MTRRYDGPRLTHGKVHYPGKAGHLNEATSPSTPVIKRGAVADSNRNFAGLIKPGAKLPTKVAQPTGPMLPQNVGKGPAPAPKPRAQEPKHSVMQPAPRPAQHQETQGAVMPPAARRQKEHQAHQARRGFGHDAQGSPFKASR
jgi:hypothetical protein